MISIITSLRNRAFLLDVSLHRICEELDWGPHSKLEINVGGGISEDNLAEVLARVSRTNTGRTVVCKKWDLPRSKSVYAHPFNCPAEEYNILVKLASSEYILKMDAEMFLVSETFIPEAYKLITSGSYIVMPLPLHTEYAPSSINESSDTIIKLSFANKYNTHINPANAQTTNVYYMAMFKRTDYLNLGGVDERFVENGIGSEDDHMLSEWRRVYGQDKTRTLTEHRAIHQWHGEWGRGVPQHLHRWVQANANLRHKLTGHKPNEGIEWGRLYEHITLTEWHNGEKVIDNKLLGELL